jgi:hypothetical protein
MPSCRPQRLETGVFCKMKVLRKPVESLVNFADFIL